MKLLIIDENGVKEFILSENVTQLQKNEDSTLQEEKGKTATENSQKQKLSLYTIADLIFAFKTSRPNIYSWIKKGYLNPISIGGRKYFKREDIESMLDENTKK